MLLSAVFGLLGVIVGAIITGIFQERYARRRLEEQVKLDVRNRRVGASEQFSATIGRLLCLINYYSLSAEPEGERYRLSQISTPLHLI